MSDWTQDKIEKLIKDVQTRLNAKRRPTGIALKVAQSGYRQDDDWLYLVVTPEKENVRVYDYVEALGEVEDELAD
jgi:hypothetical protein